jgi:hypothetical protein
LFKNFTIKYISAIFSRRIAIGAAPVYWIHFDRDSMLAADRMVFQRVFTPSLILAGTSGLKFGTDQQYRDNL